MTNKLSISTEGTNLSDIQSISINDKKNIILLYKNRREVTHLYNPHFDTALNTVIPQVELDAISLQQRQREKGWT